MSYYNNYNPPKGNIISMNKLKDKVLLGEGSVGQIFKARWEPKENDQDKHQTVAIKVYKNTTKSLVLSERTYLTTLEDQNLVRLVGLVLNNDSPWLVMEYLPDGDLRSFIINSGGISGYAMMKIACGISRGMAYLHDRNIVHGDLAARNCLVSSSVWDVKVGDFGFYSAKNEDYYYNYDVVSNKDVGGLSCPVRWMSPENLPYEFSRYGNFFRKKPTKSLDGDIWSFGVLLFEMWSRGQVPFGELTNYKVCKVLLEGEKPDDYCSVNMRRHAWDLMHSCWQLEPSYRPSFDSISSHFSKLAGFRAAEDDSEMTISNDKPNHRSRYTQFPDIPYFTGRYYGDNNIYSK